MKGRLLFTSPLVLATKALRPPFLSERWLFHKEGLRLRIICWWCNYTAGCTQRCKKYLDGCNYTLRTGWNVQKEECFHVAQICCRGVKLASALKWRSHVNLNPPISCIIQMHNTGKRQWRQRWELQLDILPRGGNRQGSFNECRSEVNQEVHATILCIYNGKYPVEMPFLRFLKKD